MVTRLFPVVGHQLTWPATGVQATPPTLLVTLVLYLTESAKYASSAVTRLRRSDFMEAMYAFPFVLANFGIAMAAKMPMITTTISSSMSVKPLRFMSFPQSESQPNFFMTTRTRVKQAVCLAGQKPLKQLLHIDLHDSMGSGAG